jgi:hypothetical protein
MALNKLYWDKDCWRDEETHLIKWKNMVKVT